MCGRFALSATTKDIEKLGYRIPEDLDAIPSDNIAPTQLIFAELNDNIGSLSKVKWGLIPYWAKDSSIGNKMFNARSETLTEKVSFKNLLKKKRCLIPAASFYEWKAIDGAKKKQKYKISLQNSNHFLFAGLWDRWIDPSTNQKVISSTIITCEPNSKMAEIHNRMPVIFECDEEKYWLDDKISDLELLNLLRPIDSEKILIEIM